MGLRGVVACRQRGQANRVAAKVHWGLWPTQGFSGIAAIWKAKRRRSVSSPLPHAIAASSMRHYAGRMTPLSNLLADIPRELPEELTQTLLRTANLRIERIVSLGQTSPEGYWYDQNAAEWVLVIQGAARLRLEGEEPLDMTPGSFLNIPAHRRHRVEWTDPNRPTVWLAIHHTG
jgi:cupin 2 domain-containing protein